MALLVDEETELLATIDRYKAEAQKYNKEVNIQRFLERVAQPKRWKYKDGTTTEIYNDKISDTGTYSGTFSSSYVETINDVMIAELLNTSGDSSDPCEDGTETIYARAMIDLDGDGE